MVEVSNVYVAMKYMNSMIPEPPPVEYSFICSNVVSSVMKTTCKGTIKVKVKRNFVKGFIGCTSCQFLYTGVQYHCKNCNQFAMRLLFSKFKNGKYELADDLLHAICSSCSNILKEVEPPKIVTKNKTSIAKVINTKLNKYPKQIWDISSQCSKCNCDTVWYEFSRTSVTKFCSFCGEL